MGNLKKQLIGNKTCDEQLLIESNRLQKKLQT